MKFRAPAFAAGVVLLISSAASAQVVRQGMVEISPFAGYLFGGSFARGTTSLFDTRVDVADHFDFGGRIGYYVTSKFALEAQYTRSETNFETHIHDNTGGLFGPGERQNLGDLNIDYFLGSMVFNFGHERAVPYISFGAGAARLTPHIPDTPTTNETRFTATAAAGLKVFFQRNIGMRFEGRYYGTSLPDSSRHDCDHRFESCDNRGWLSNGDVTGGLIFAF